MRKISGYLCAWIESGRFYKSEYVLCGKNIDEKRKKLWLNFEANGLTPFKTESQAHKALEELLKQDITVSVQLARLKMCMAVTLDEMQELKDSKSLVAIQHNDDEGWTQSYTIFGPCRIDGAPTAYPLSGTLIGCNGLKGWKDYDAAFWAVNDICRQAQRKAYLADWNLELIGHVVKGPAYKG